MSNIEQNSIEKKKELFIDAMMSQLGNITKSCEIVGIKSRTTIYNWMENDPVFREAINNIDEFVIDFAENSLFKQIQEGNTAATIFYLKTKGQKRGYVEKQIQEVNIIEQPLFPE
ncbi:MAG: hypothetical protein NXI00_16140 [Cytophagales bacterium]|nr:hypothetical protein [Cytophagales bacterium]